MDLLERKFALASHVVRKGRLFDGYALVSRCLGGHILTLLQNTLPLILFLERIKSK